MKEMILLLTLQEILILKFVEIKFNKKKNLIIGSLYRHPSSKIPIQEFNHNFLDPVLQKINNEQKQCIYLWVILT